MAPKPYSYPAMVVVMSMLLLISITEPNIDVMKRAGVTDLVSISACGSLKEDYAPGSFVLVDQFIDRTFARPKSFFGKGCVAHVSLAHPVSPLLMDMVEEAAEAEALDYAKGGVYLAMEGPQFRK